MRNFDEGVFRNAREALVFALNYRGEQFAKSTLAVMAQEGSIGSGRGLHGLDGAATAAIVKAKLERLTEPGLAALIASCSLPGTDAWSAAIEEMQRFVCNSPTFATMHAELVELCVRKHFGERKTFSEIADAVGMDRVTANRKGLLIKAELDRLQAEAWSDFDESLRPALIREDY
ncbi:hypothetical protein QF000_006669 [Paraburkholderia atlantica]|uniref:hypothetical protein n=1 Tax=Paraburkholderia atlantica TaxID=2654982 RepID=UPI003D21CC96